jgi:hypothetical protein
MFIGLNPSTADEAQDDPTIRRCIGFAKTWGFGGIYMLNLFAYRATNPKEIRLVEEPIGGKNDDYLKGYFAKKGLNIACWGIWGTFMNRGDEVINMLGKANLSCLGMTKIGQPKHPLYLKGDTVPTSMTLFENRQLKTGMKKI